MKKTIIDEMLNGDFEFNYHKSAVESDELGCLKCQKERELLSSFTDKQIELFQDYENILFKIQFAENKYKFKYGLRAGLLLAIEILNNSEENG